MTRWGQLGLDPIDVAIHLVVTGCLMAFLAATADGVDRPAGLALIGAGSAVLLGVRRWWAQRKAARSVPSSPAELEGRLGTIEATLDAAGWGELPARLAEVEERLDFAERVLARQAEPPRLPEDAQR
jgi:hypothetical protein